MTDMNPDPFAQAQRDAHELSHGNFGSLGGTPNQPTPQVLRIKEKVGKVQIVTRPGKERIPKGLIKPLRNPELIGKHAPGKKPANIKPPAKAKAASRIPLATKDQAATIRPVKVHVKVQSKDKDKAR